MLPSHIGPELLEPAGHLKSGFDAVTETRGLLLYQADEQTGMGTRQAGASHAAECLQMYVGEPSWDPAGRRRMKGDAAPAAVGE